MNDQDMIEFLKERQSFPLSKKLRKLLGKDLNRMVLFLLASDLNARIPLYIEKYSNIIKVPRHDSEIYYYWNDDSKLWEEHKIKSMRIELRNIINSVYYQCVLSIKTLIDSSTVDNKYKKTKKNKKPTIKTLPNLIDRLEELREKATKNFSLNEIIEPFISENIDLNFEKLINPPYFIAVKGKKLLNLKTGQLKNREMTDYCTKEISVEYNPDAKSTLFDKFIQDITLGDKEAIIFLQTVLGYSIIGNGNEGKMFILHGDSSAGKTTLARLLKILFEDYFATLNNSVIIKTGKKNDDPDPFLARLDGRRIGLISEIGMKDTMNIDKVKNLTTKDNYNYRMLFSNTIKEMKTSHTLFLLTNYKPNLEECDNAIWRRLVLLYFKACFVKEPKKPNERPIVLDLEEKLSQKEHMEAFFSWIVEGSIRYHQEGLVIPKSNLEDIENYKDHEDELAEFISECCVLSKEYDEKKFAVRSKELYSRYCDWCSEYRMSKENIKIFNAKLEKKGFQKKKRKGLMYFIGIKTKTFDISDLEN